MSRDEQLKCWIEQYYDRLMYLAYTNVRNQTLAQDIVQDSMIKAYRSMDQLKDQERPYPWLVRIVINSCRDVSRHKHSREIPTEYIPERLTTSTEDVYVERSQRSEIYQAIMVLPEKYRNPLILFYFEELSTKEIAEVLNQSEGAIRTQLKRGRDQLKTILERSEEYGVGAVHSGSKA